jgi:hypothetical protein
VTFDAYLFEAGRFDLYDTDGHTEVSAEVSSGTLTIEARGAKQRLGFRLLPLKGGPTVEAVQVNGKEVERQAMLEIGTVDRG